MPRISLLQLFGCLLLPLTACHKGGGGSAPPQQRLFITWTGSAAGDVVLDYDNEYLRFFADSDTLLFRGIEFVNVRVDPQASVIWNGQVIGGVVYIMSTTNQVITGLVSSAGNMIDIYQSGSGYFWSDSGVAPQFAPLPLVLVDDPEISERRALTSFSPAEGGMRLEDPDLDSQVVLRGRFEHLQAAEIDKQPAKGDISAPLEEIHR